MNISIIKYFLFRGDSINQPDFQQVIKPDYLNYYQSQESSDSLMVDFIRGSIFILDRDQYYQISQDKETIENEIQHLTKTEHEDYINNYCIKHFGLPEDLRLLNALKVLLRQGYYADINMLLVTKYGPLVNISGGLNPIMIDIQKKYMCSINKIFYIDTGKGKNYTIGYTKTSIEFDIDDIDDIVINTTIDLLYNPANIQHIEYLSYQNKLFSKYILIPYLEGQYNDISDLQLSINTNNFWDNMDKISIANYFTNFIVFIDAISYIYHILEPIGMINIPQLDNYDIILLQYNHQQQLFNINHYSYQDNYQMETSLGMLPCPIEKLYQHNYLFIIHLHKQLPITQIESRDENIILWFIKKLLHYRDNDQLHQESIICGNNNNLSNYMNIIRQEDFEFIEVMSTNQTSKKTKSRGWFGKGNKRKTIKLSKSTT